MKETITALRREMKRRGIFAYVVLTEDFHGSEYVGEHFRLREYLSGFTGSAGTLVVTENDAALWTDGRYFIQAACELSDSGIVLMKQGEPNVPTVEKFLREKMPDNSVLGFDGRAVNAAFARKLQNALADKHITFSTDEDVGGAVWKNRPPLSKQPVFAVSRDVCGMSRAEKLERVRGKIRSENADCLALSALDEIAWLLNLRGNDVEYNPVFLSFMIVYSDRVQLFAERSIFGGEILSALNNDGVEILPYDEIYNALLKLQGTVWVDERAVNLRFWDSLKNAERIAKQSPVTLMKACKNPVEITSEKSAHIKDGLAVTRFMMWLYNAVKDGGITEISAAGKLDEFRKMGKGYLGQSFAPIMAYGAHGAIVHYSATDKTNAEILPRGLLLSDTGGHYIDGTTDITRTFVLGELSDEEKRAYTLVLAAHLDLLSAVFPNGVRGSVLDGIARQVLWQNGLDFNHGTGHGVGFLLNVHEPPQRISWRSSNDAVLCEGMITSDEPGLYFEGKFGIRHESLLLCEKSEFDGFLKFSPLTCVPFDTAGIDKRYLTDKQTLVLNDYHKWVRKTLLPFMNDEEKKWLEEITREI